MLKIDENKLYTRREVAKLGFRSYDALAGDAVRGVGLPMLKIGSKVFYRGDKIIAFLEAAEVKTDAA